MDNLNESIFNSAIETCKEIGAKAVILFVDLFTDLDAIKAASKDADFILVSQDMPVPPKELNGIKFIQLPHATLSRMGLIKISIMMAISAGYLLSTDKVVCLSGLKSVGCLDTMIIVDLNQESEIIISRESYDISSEVKPEVFGKILAFCVELAKQGRENDPIGTIFVVGDHKKVLDRSRQLIMNPFHGYSDHEKHILNTDLRETIKEYSSIDGAFVISGEGVVLSAGRHLNTSLEDEELTPGLGCRHAAAAGITSQTKAVALVISQSTGSVRIFKDGKVIMKIEKNVT